MLTPVGGHQRWPQLVEEHRRHLGDRAGTPVDAPLR